MATLVKRGKKWFVQVRRNGITRCKSFTTKSEAANWGTATEAEILAGKQERRTDKTLRDALERYLQEVTPLKRGQRWESVRIRKFMRLPFVDYKLHDVATPRLAEWRDEQLKTLKGSSVNREMNLLSSIFEQCRREWQWIDSNPVRDVRRPAQPKHRERLFSDAERDAIVSALSEAPGNKQWITGQAFLFALETGMRRQEITGLEWGRIDAKRRVASLDKTKNGDAREVPLSSRAQEILEGMREFPRPFDVDADVLTALFGRACKAAGIENAHFHDARATAITRLSKKLDVLQLARMIGHRDVKSLMVYYRETAEEIANILG